jgi:predicted ATP-grasp superfamily ATP-dependent carboligase
MTKRVFVYEYLSGGGWLDYGGDAAADELLPLGRSMRDAMVADLLRMADCSVSAAACEPGNTLPAGAVPLRPRANESAFAFVARQCALHDVTWLVAPETHGLLARFQRTVGDARWLGCSAEAIALTAGKQATLARLAAHGVATPLAFQEASDVERWVVKPDDGAGGVDTQVHADHASACEDQARRAQAGATLTLEPWVEGDALSLSLLCTPGSIELLSINRQRIAVDARGSLSFEGVTVNALTRDDPRTRSLAALAVQVGRAIPGLHGFAGIDLVWHARRGPVVIEVNPRVTCAYVGLSAALGRNLAADLMAGGPRGHGHQRELAHAHG